MKGNRQKTSGEKTPRSKNLFSRLFYAFMLLAVILLVVPPAAGYAVFSFIRYQLKGRLQGNYEPVFFRPAFRLHRVNLYLPGKAKLESGDVTVSYRPESLLSRTGMRLVLEGSNLPVELISTPLGENFKKISLEHFRADIKLKRGEIKEIYSLEAASPDLNLKLGRS